MSTSIQYIEIVTNAVDAICATYERVHGLSFRQDEDADLGNARVAVRDDGSWIGVRKPLADHETPIIRTYIEVDDIDKAAKDAEASGGMVAYPPTRQGKHGTFAIFIQDEIQHGLWQK